MSDQDSSNQASSESTVPVTMPDNAPRKPRSWAKGLLSVIGILLILSVLALALIFQTQIGSRVFLQSLQTISGGHLSVGEVQGKLADEIHIDELTYQDAQHQVRMSGVHLKWQAWSLWRGRIDVADLAISTLRIASVPSQTAATMPTSLQLPVTIDAQQIAVGRLVLSTLSTGGQELDPIELKALVGKLVSSDQEHQVSLQLDSSWGGLRLESKINTRSPFQINGDFTYQGQANAELPKVLIQGSVNGSLQELHVQAKSVEKSRDGQLADAKQQVKANLQLRVAPFSVDPLRAIELEVSKLNPQWIHPQAPFASLDVSASLQPAVKSGAGQKIAAASQVNLAGDVRIQNKQAASIDQHGLPFKTLTSKINWQGDKLQFQKSKLELISGVITAESQLQFRPAKLPLLEMKMALKDIDLATIDHRLRQTNIQGALQLQAKEARRLDFQAQLKDPRASLDADASFLLNQAGDSGLLQLKRFELQADQARLSGNGEVHFDGSQAFKLQTKLTQFDPSQWWTAPPGKIDGEISVMGNLAGKPLVKVQFPNVAGELSGQRISASGQVEWQQATSLKLTQLELLWGANKLLANGSLGNSQDQIDVQLQADDLALFESVTAFSLTGTAKAQGFIRGKLDALSAKLSVHADDLRSSRGLAIGQLDGEVQLGANPNDLLKLQLNATGIKSASISLNSTAKGGQGLAIEKRKNLMEQLQIAVHGTLSQHKIEASAKFDQSQQLSLVAQGGVDNKLSQPRQRGKVVETNKTWSGRVDQLKVSGFAARVSPKMPIDDMILLAPVNLSLSRDKVAIGNARLAGGIGNLALESLEWTPQSLSTKAKWDELPVMELVKLVRPQETLQGDLRVGLKWDLQLKDSLRGDISMVRQRGDLSVLDADGTGQAMALGLKTLNLQLQAGGLIAGTDAERVKIQLDADGIRSGQWRARMETQIRRENEKWTFNSEAPMTGELHANTSELQWLVGQLSSEFAVKGALTLDASFGGKMSKPTYQASLEGRGLELAFASEGLLFPNGELRAQLTQDIFKLEHLRFSNKVSFVPRVEQLQELDWNGREGTFNATGEVNWRTQAGSIQADWKSFPLLQRKDRWLVVSGQANITQVDNVWGLLGKLRADAAYFKLPKLPPPSLSSDVVVSKGAKLIDEDVELDTAKKGLKTKLDLQIEMGPRFVFVGRGLNTALTGTLRLRSTDGSPVHASGSIVTNGGQYEGYGQQLEIERGILNFQGAPSNPALNIRALRKGLPVEAGVDVTGTVASPQVRLVSEPNVPDSEKISWLVLGREADQVGTADASLLLSAAGAIFGGDGSRNIPRELVQGLGFDEFSIGPAESGGSSKLPSQTVAGAISVGASSNDKVVNIGKRLKPGIVLSVERGVSDASGALKLSWQLSRRVRFIGRSGTDNSVDVKYSFSFN